MCASVSVGKYLLESEASVSLKDGGRKMEIKLCRI